MIVGKLVKSPREGSDKRSTGEWLGSLAELDHGNDEYSLTQLADYLKLSKVSVTRVFLGLIEPDRKKSGKTFASFYPTKELVKIGKWYLNGQIFKVRADEED
jgi:hypothetical protein